MLRRSKQLPGQLARRDSAFRVRSGAKHQSRLRRHSATEAAAHQGKGEPHAFSLPHSIGRGWGLRPPNFLPPCLEGVNYVFLFVSGCCGAPLSLILPALVPYAFHALPLVLGPVVPYPPGARPLCFPRFAPCVGPLVPYPSGACPLCFPRFAPRAGHCCPLSPRRLSLMFPALCSLRRAPRALSSRRLPLGFSTFCLLRTSSSTRPDG